MISRVLWTYEHPTARLQEMMLFPAAGSEVVPTYTESPTGWLDSRYHDESHPMYPRWREYCSLPVNLVERVRRAALWERDFRVDPEEAQLINDNFSGMFINCSPGTLANIFSWYTGKVLFRCNGGPNRTDLYKDARAWVETAKQAGRLKDFIYLPGHFNLVVPEMYEAGVKIIHFPVFAEEARIPGRWAGRASNQIATAISYLDFHSHFQGQLRDVVDAYGGSDLHVRVFGKNKLIQTATDNIEIVGGLPSDNDFWGQIFNCAAFVDAGKDPTHTVFPPLEAAVKGMPVFFQRDNGHPHALQDFGVTVPLDERIGILPSHSDICDFLLKHHNDLNLLKDINERQVALLKSYFSRENALKACAEIASILGSQDRPVSLKPVALAGLPEPRLPLAKVLDGRAGSTGFGRLNARHGRVQPEDQQVVCAEEPGPVAEKQVLSENLPSLPPGRYVLEVHYSAKRSNKNKPQAGRMELGIWANGTDYQRQVIVLPGDKGYASLEFIIDETSQYWGHEVRISAYTWLTVTFQTLGLQYLGGLPGQVAAG